MVYTNYRVLLASLAVFTLAIAISSFRIVKEYEFIGNKFIPNLWVAAQAEIEFLRFIEQLDTHVHRETEAADELATRLYVLWSRLPLLLQGSESEHVRAVEGAVRTVEELTATLEQLEPTVLALEKGDVAAYREVYATLKTFEIPLHRIVAQTMLKDEEVASAQREGVRRVYWEVLGCFVGMVASATALVVLLFRAVRNVGGLLHVAHAAEAAAERASRAKSEFLAAMSHEIRTPLTAVLGMADLLAAAELPGRERRYVEAIRTSGRHLLSVVNDILDFSRIEAGRLELERVDFSVPEVLEQVRSLTAPQAAERGLELGFELDEHSPPVVRGDPTRLRQVLLNLVGNGLKFTHQGGIVVRAGSCPASEGGVRLRFEVHDTGIGVPKERQAELFDAFTQADRSTSRTYGGSGLGLAISKRLVEAMGGAIGVESVPGRGSCFWFEVPLEPGDAAVAAEKATFDLATVQPLRILLAEDVALNRELLGAMLGQHDHEIVFAVNGAEAVELAGRERFDLILMDVQMPAMDGLEATRRIRRLPAPAGAVPILALTANVMAAEHERCLAAGMNRVLTKPVAWPELFAALAEGAGRSTSGMARAREDGARGMACLDAGGSKPPLFVELAADPPRDKKLAGLLLRAIDDAERSCERLWASSAESEELLREAHTLKGTAGLFGLRRISAAAEEVQAAARAGRETSETVARLVAAVAMTRKELQEAGWIPGVSPAAADVPSSSLLARGRSGFRG